MQPKCNSLFFHQMKSITLELSDAFVHQLAHLHRVTQQSWGEVIITRWNLNPKPNSSLNPKTNSNYNLNPKQNPNPNSNPTSKPNPKPNPTLPVIHYLQ